MSGGLMSGGRMSGGRLSGGLKSYDRCRPVNRADGAIDCSSGQAIVGWLCDPSVTSGLDSHWVITLYWSLSWQELHQLALPLYD